MNIKAFREKVNLFIYDAKPKVLAVLTVMNILVSLTAISTLVYYYGFKLTDFSEYVCFTILELSFGFYIFRYFIKLFFDFHPPTFIRNNWFEGIISLLLLVEGVSYNFRGSMIIEPLFFSMGFQDFGTFSMIFVQLFVFIILLNNLFKQHNFKPWMKIHPGWLFTISIGLMTLLGGLLLMLPEMSSVENGMGFIDSLFLSMSSVSVTGLSTVDVANTLTFKGQIIVLILIKLGGLNTIAFGALMLVIAKFGVGIKYHEVIEDFVNSDSILKAGNMLAKIVLWATTIEVIGIALLFIGFGNEGVFADTGDRFFQAVFHGVSGFNNAGLSTLEGGLMHPELISNTFVHTIMLILFFFGGFGMIYMFDLFEIKRLRERMKTPWKTIEFGTKISLYFTLGLLVFGAVIFLIFEWNNGLSEKGVLGAVVTALFESMTTRNAGFNVVDTSALSMPVVIIFLFLMFIGASSGSAGGGIRTSTFAIMWAALISTIKGKSNTELFKRTISNDTVLKAYAIFLFFILGNIIGPFVLAISEADLLASGKYDFMDLVFEHVSALSTVGLSTGMTAEMSSVGKVVLIVAMFIGRVGTLTLAYLVGKRVISKNYKYPKGHTMVG
ncbi:MAG: potassium transporter TrkG [Crocinitomicaceae bacterium]|nr:potassium transporter TrkG [Crocinitomicaceae bacterium]MDG1777087.1 potassium transporter TrkG [Crocinitomicaceae bacterium]